MSYLLPPVAHRSFKTAAVAGIAIAILSVAQSASDACALLTAAEISAAVGQTVSAGQTSVSGDGTVACSYGYGSLNQFGVEIWQAPSAAEAQKKLAHDLQESRNQSSHKTTEESGVGEGAFAWTMELGTMRMVTLSAVHGPRFLRIGAISDHAVPLDRLRALMLKALSR